MGEVFDALALTGTISGSTATAMKKAVGFRNIDVHNYGQISWAIVHAISQQHSGDFRQFAREVSRALPAGAGA
jgi:uncharacterized protein YutE (UPF0331/DUF86 family)